MAERLNPEELDRLRDKFTSAREAEVPLLEWAETLRE